MWKLKLECNNLNVTECDTDIYVFYKDDNSNTIQGEYENIMLTPSLLPLLPFPLTVILLRIEPVSFKRQRCKGG